MSILGIDEEGRIAAIFPHVSVEGHVDEVLAAVRSCSLVKSALQ